MPQSHMFTAIFEFMFDEGKAGRTAGKQEDCGSALSSVSRPAPRRRRVQEHDSGALLHPHSFNFGSIDSNRILIFKLKVKEQKEFSDLGKKGTASHQ